jgi:DNA-binding MarR family transcriptional regulator
VARKEGTTDKRVREAIVTAAGKAMTDRIDAARERIGRSIFESWGPQDIDDLVRLMRKFADAAKEEPYRGS